MSVEAVTVRKALIPALLLVLAAVGARHAAASLSGAAGATNGPLVETGTFALAAELQVRYPPKACPPGTPSSIECYSRTGSATIRGLGTLTESYPYSVEGLPVGCAVDQVRVLPATVRLSVASRGEIELRVNGSACINRVPPAPVQGVEAFTVTGGSGRYAGASGGGTIAHVSNGPPVWSGRDTWTGTIVVPGLDFDLSAPVMGGVRNRTVRPREGRGVSASSTPFRREMMSTARSVSPAGRSRAAGSESVERACAAPRRIRAATTAQQPSSSR